MELMEIIYSSLGLVASFLFLAIIFSYMANAVRKKGDSQEKMKLDYKQPEVSYFTPTSTLKEDNTLYREQEYYSHNNASTQRYEQRFRTRERDRYTIVNNRYSLNALTFYYDERGFKNVV